MVVIVDPHLKRTQDYPIYKEASELEVLVKLKNGEGEYEGWCWSGSSSWVDFFNPASWGWWSKLFRTKADAKEWTWVDSTDDVFIWNDMNEVSYSISCLPSLLTQLPSLPYLTALRSPCRKTVFTMVDGSTVISTTSMECC